MRQKDRRALSYATRKLDAIIGAARGETTSCAVFHAVPGMREEFTPAQRQAIAVYLDTWVREPLKAALDAIDGDRSYGTDSYLDSLACSVEPTREELENIYQGA